MRALYLLVFVIQFTFAFHALKTGRGTRWIVIIFMAPVVGSLLYYFLEVFPNSREERTLRRRIRDIAKALNPDAELKRRAAEAEINASVENRAALAAKYAAHFGFTPDFLDAYWSGLSFDLDQPMIDGLRAYYRMAAEIGEIPSAPELRWLPAGPAT